MRSHGFLSYQLTAKDPNYTVIKVTLNNFIMVFAFAAIVDFLPGVTETPILQETLLLSVSLYVTTPLIAGILTRIYLTKALNIQACVKTFINDLK